VYTRFHKNFEVREKLKILNDKENFPHAIPKASHNPLEKSVVMDWITK
jgi:hypothetical protein